ncbi:MAG TPA: MerR family transcriptional regulator [Acidimicrobiales bacterium]|nr:MerR family transcriptional regulator [Acidimicrobiales bacterium]
MSVSGGRMKIGEVHALLRQDFPDIELSKIRYYEDKGLVEPSRSRKGYRLYSDRDVACLREAIRLAQEEFVPLRVVRLRLVEQGLLNDGPSSVARQVARDAAAPMVTAPIPAVAPAARPALSVVRPSSNDANTSAPATEYAAPESLRELGLDATVLNQLVGLGLVAPSSLVGETTFSEIDIRIAQAAGALLSRGSDGRFLSALRRVVEREVGVIEDVTEPLRSPSRRMTRDETRAAVAAVTSEVETLRTLLLERALSTYLGH